MTILAAVLAVGLLILWLRRAWSGAALAKKIRSTAGDDDPRIGRRYGKYRVLDRIGAGNMSTVYRALHDGARSHREVVALKIMIPEAASGQQRLVERFRREASISTDLEHPNIMRVLDCGEESGELYIATEFLAGRTLRECMVEGGMPVSQFAPLFRQLCAALGHAHDRGIVHRDIKPENIMVLGNDTIKLMDFGLAKGFLHSGLTMKGFTVGTPAYMAPEQIMSKGLDHRTDQYSLGVVAFEMLTGSLPFFDYDVESLMTWHMEKDPPRPAEFRPDLPPALDAMILRMLEKEPSRRFYDMHEVLKAFDAARKMGVRD